MDAIYNTFDNIPPIFETEYWLKQKLLYLPQDGTNFSTNKIVGITKNSHSEGLNPGCLVSKVYSYDSATNVITNSPTITTLLPETSEYITTQTNGVSTIFNNGNNPKIKRLTTLNFLVASLAVKNNSGAIPNQIGNVSNDFLLMFNLVSWNSTNDDTLIVNYTTGGTITAGASSDYDVDIIDSNHFVVSTSALAGLVQIYEINSTFDNITLLTQLQNTTSTEVSTIQTVKVIDNAHFILSRFIPGTNVSELITYSFDSSYNITEIKRITLANGTVLRDFTFEIDINSKYGIIFGYDPGAPGGTALIMSGYISYNSDLSVINAAVSEESAFPDGINVDIYSFNTQPEIQVLTDSYFLVTTGHSDSIAYFLYKQRTYYPYPVMARGWATDSKRNVSSVSTIIINKNIIVSSWADESTVSTWGRISAFHIYDRTQLTQSINMSVYSNGAWQQGIGGWIYEKGGWRLMKNADVFANSSMNHPFIESHDYANSSPTSAIWGSDTSTINLTISSNKPWTISYMPSWITYKVGMMIRDFETEPPTSYFEDCTNYGTFGTGFILKLTPSSTTSSRTDVIKIAINSTNVLSIPVSQGATPVAPTISMSNSAFSVVSHNESVTLNSTNVPFDITPTNNETNVNFALYKDGVQLNNQMIIAGTLESNTKYSNYFTLASAATYNEVYEIKVTKI